MKYIYVINQESTFYFKVGKTINFQQRLKTLQTANPNKLFFVRLYYVENADLLELNLLKYLKKFQDSEILGGSEWFYSPYPKAFLSSIDQFIATDGELANQSSWDNNNNEY